MVDYEERTDDDEDEFDESSSVMAGKLLRSV